jgi:hypothetical protein
VNATALSACTIAAPANARPPAVKRGAPPSACSAVSEGEGFGGGGIDMTRSSAPLPAGLDLEAIGPALSVWGDSGMTRR